jgi:DNA-binding transcriptional LysR family regulator
MTEGLSMDIKYFEYVIEIVECGSINKAAQNLQMLQPNLSVCIKNLEQELGFPIFCRQHSGIRLTSEGELFLKSARKIATELETIHNIPSMFSHKDNLSISCTYSFDFMNHFLKFKKKKPPTACEDSFKETGLIQTIRDVVEQRYRMSLFYCFDTVSDTYYALAKKHNLKLIPIARNRPLILLASKKNPLSRKKEIPFDSITDYKFIMYENFKFDEWLKILNFKNDNNILYVFDRGGLIDAIRQSRYVTVMMKRFTDTYSEDCVEISIVDAPFGMDAYCLHHASYTMNSREKQFIRELKELFADPPAERPI